MVQIICLDSGKHAVKMMTEIHRMKRENDHCDFIIQVENDVYYTHKNILSAGSEYFKAMLKHDTEESRAGKVVFQEMDSECVKKCVDFIYSGKLEIPDEKMIDLLHVGIMMQLEDVKQAVSDILRESISVVNYFSTSNVADMYSLDPVSALCRVFFHENIMEISNQSEFGNIDKMEILNFVKSEESKLCEEEKLTVSLKWVEKIQKNEEHLHECLEAIRFDKISPVFLEHLLESNPVINKDLGFYKLIYGKLLKVLKRSINSKEKIGNEDLIVLFDLDTHYIRSFNSTTDKIEKFHDEKFQTYMKHFGTISLDSHIYVLCDYKSVRRLNFRVKNSKWEEMKDMICHHGANPRSVSLSGSIFVIGGSFPRTSSAVETFHPSINQWFQLQSKPTAIINASLVSLKDSIYCIGGLRQDAGKVSSFCRFTPSSSEWVDLQPMRNPVCGSGVVAVDQKIFVIGGWKGGEKVNNVECYDVSSAQWTSLSSLNARYGAVSAHYVDNWIIAISESEISNDIEKYDISKDKWIIVQPKVDQCFRIYRSTMVKI